MNNLCTKTINHILNSIIENPHEDPLDLLLRRCDHSLFDKYNLHQIILSGNIKMAKFLIKEEFCINSTAQLWPDKDSILHTIVRSKNLELLKFYINSSDSSFKEQVNKSNGKNHTPLMIAAEFGFVDGARLLLKNHAEIQARDYPGETLLHKAAKSGNLDVVNLFIQESFGKVNINSTTNIDKSTSLHYAIKSEHFDINIIKSFINNGADVNRKTCTNNSRGDNSLHYAIRHRRTLPLIELLVEKGADINAQNKHGETALDLAINSECDIKIIQFLNQFSKIL